MDQEECNSGVCNFDILETEDATFELINQIITSLRVKKLKENAHLPTRGSADAAGWDLYAAIDAPVSIQPGTTVKIGTGLAIALPKYTFGGVFARSGLATKKGLRPANCVGVCDEDYRGEYIVALHNDSNEVQVVMPDERIAQLIILPYVVLDMEEVQELDSTERGDNGFGSTGTK